MGQKIRRRWRHGPHTTILQNSGGGVSHTRTGPGRPPPGRTCKCHRRVFGSHTSRCGATPSGPGAFFWCHPSAISKLPPHGWGVLESWNPGCLWMGAACMSVYCMGPSLNHPLVTPLFFTPSHCSRCIFEVRKAQKGQGGSDDLYILSTNSFSQVVFIPLPERGKVGAGIFW